MDLFICIVHVSAHFETENMGSSKSDVDRWTDGRTVDRQTDRQTDRQNDHSNLRSRMQTEGLLYYKQLLSDKPGFGYT